MTQLTYTPALLILDSIELQVIRISLCLHISANANFTGQCDLIANVNCIGNSGTTTASCYDAAGDAVVNGDVENPDSCTSFFRCISGVAGSTAIECSTGMQFNPAIGQCDLEANRDPVCTASASIAALHAPITKVVKQDHSPALTFRDQVLARLHLNH